MFEVALLPSPSASYLQWDGVVSPKGCCMYIYGTESSLCTSPSVQCKLATRIGPSASDLLIPPLSCVLCVRTDVLAKANVRASWQCANCNCSDIVNIQWGRYGRSDKNLMKY
jgi:hypothetical protein